MKFKDDTVPVIALILFIAFMSFIAGLAMGVDTLKVKAIEAGVGYYAVNPTNGITQFEFKTQKP